MALYKSFIIIIIIIIISFRGRLVSTSHLPARRYASTGRPTCHGPVSVSVSVCVSVTSRRSIEAVRRFELVIDMEA